jgi:ElaB/YqjD/DUF883 family membrane-anchored ribosome-binding protein
MTPSAAPGNAPAGGTTPASQGTGEAYPFPTSEAGASGAGAQSAKEKVASTMSQAREKVAETAAQAREKVAGATTAARTRMAETAATVRERAADTAAMAEDRVMELRDAARGEIQRAPFAAVGIALAVGFVLGMISAQGMRPSGWTAARNLGRDAARSLGHDLW